MRAPRILTGLVYRLRNLPAGLKRFKFWIYVLLFLVFLGLVSPWVGLLREILRAGWGILRPVLDNPVGRFVAANVVLFFVIVFLYRRFRERGRRLIGAWALDRFLAGLLHLASGRWKKAARAFETVLRVARFVDLPNAVPSYPEILSDARIKLALCHRETGDLPKAMRSLELLKVRDLSPKMKQELGEAKAFVYSLSDELMEETIDREIANALEIDPKNRRLLRLRRDRAERLGDLEIAVEAQRRIVKVAGVLTKQEERTRLAALHARLALRHYREGRVEDARIEISRSRASDPTLVLPGLLSGEIEADRGDAKAAVREWSRHPSVPALERVGELLQENRLDGEKDLQFLVESFPRAGILTVLADHYIRVGKLRRARNCLVKLEELGLENRHSAHLLAEVCRREGDFEAAERLEWRALKGFLGVDRSPTPGKD